MESRIDRRLAPRAEAAGLEHGGRLNLGDPRDYRVPDIGYYRLDGDAVYVPTAAVVVETLSPGDETYDKFGFYAGRGVEELLVVDPEVGSVQWWQLADGAYVQAPASTLLDVTGIALAAEIAWP